MILFASLGWVMWDYSSGSGLILACSVLLFSIAAVTMFYVVRYIQRVLFVIPPNLTLTTLPLYYGGKFELTWEIPLKSTIASVELTLTATRATVIGYGKTQVTIFETEWSEVIQPWTSDRSGRASTFLPHECALTYAFAPTMEGGRSTCSIGITATAKTLNGKTCVWHNSLKVTSRMEAKK